MSIVEHSPILPEQSDGGTARIVSIQVGRPRLVMYNGAPVSTAIFKAPVEGPVTVSTLNIEGDRQANLAVHGGVDKAVYAYPSEHYADWAREIERDDLAYGQFGENLTVEGLLEEDVRVGDRYRAGTVLMEVSQPRVPCRNLAIRMQDGTFPKRFIRSRRSGFYLRVLEEGTFEPGATIERVGRDEEAFTIRALYELMFGERIDADELERAIATPALSEEWRQSLSHRK